MSMACNSVDEDTKPPIAALKGASCSRDLQSALAAFLRALTDTASQPSQPSQQTLAPVLPCPSPSSAARDSLIVQAPCPRCHNHSAPNMTGWCSM